MIPRTQRKLGKALLVALMLGVSTIALNVPVAETASAQTPREYTRSVAQRECGANYQPKRGVRVRDRSGNARPAFVWVFQNTNVKRYCIMTVKFGNWLGVRQSMNARVVVHVYRNGSHIATTRNRQDRGEFQYWAGPVRIDYGNLRSQYPNADDFLMVVSGHVYTGSGSCRTVGCGAVMYSDFRSAPARLANSWSWIGY